MSDILYLTWQHLIFNRGRIGLLVVLVTLVAVLPLSLNLLFADLVGGSASAASANGSLWHAAVGIAVAISSLVTVLALALELRSRRAEIEVLARIGCSGARIWALLVLEVLLVGLAAGALVAVALALVHVFSDDLLNLAPIL
ncbi:MAG: hypothetical protein QNK18_07395 [Gammaproteobacteria bacterium]|nr:hypothetical protein [Gammaproteobacteria bacterium]